MRTIILEYEFGEYEFDYSKEDIKNFLHGNSLMNYIPDQELIDYEITTEEEALDYVYENDLIDEIIEEFKEYFADLNYREAFEMHSAEGEPGGGAAEVAWGCCNPLY